MFFGNYLNPQQPQAYAAAANDPLGLAMDTLRLSSPVMSPVAISTQDIPQQDLPARH